MEYLTSLQRSKLQLMMMSELQNVFKGSAITPEFIQETLAKFMQMVAGEPVYVSCGLGSNLAKIKGDGDLVTSDLNIRNCINQYNKSVGTSFFIQIENKYTWVQNIVFALSDLRAIDTACNSGQTAILTIDGRSDYDPPISYKDFVRFFTDVINAIPQLDMQTYIFKLTINEDLSCEWCDFHRTSSN